MPPTEGPFWGFRIRACRPYRARTKGKVERPVRYVRDNFVYGREFLGDGDLDAQGAHWLEHTANARVHGTTKAVPRVRFETEERPTLRPLAPAPYASLLVPAAPVPAPVTRVLPPGDVHVERRALRAYDHLAQLDPLATLPHLTAAEVSA